MTGFLLALALVGLTQPAAPPCDVSGNEGVEIRSWSGGAERLILCGTSGHSLEPTGPNTWLGNGVYLVAASPQASRLLGEVIVGADEATFEAEPPRFTLTRLTYRSDQEPRVPLVRYEIDQGRSGIAQTAFFVLRGPRFSESEFRDAMRRFGAPETTAEERDRLLTRLRDLGVGHPRAALRLIAPLRDSPQADGDVGEHLSEVVAELELARDLPRR